MKNLKNKYIVATLLLNLCFGINPAQAGFFDSVIEASRRALEISKDVAAKTIDASAIALEKAKELAESTLDYTKDQIEQIEKERTNKKDDTTIAISSHDTNKNSQSEKAEEILNLEISQEHKITLATGDSSADHLQYYDDGRAFPWIPKHNVAPSIGNTTSSSVVSIEGATKRDTRWVMLIITKDNLRQQVLLEAQDGTYKTQQIGLMGGAGTYDVQIAESSDPNQLQSYFVTGNKKITNLDTRDMAYLLTSTEIQSTDPRIVELAHDIAGHANTQREALELINEWMVANITYDWDAYKTGSYKTDVHDAVSIMEKRTAVCEGYSRLFAALARAAGIKAKQIHGKGFTGLQWGGHAWNEVFIEGKWLNVDTTWNKPMNPKKYFLIDDEKFSKDHKRETELEF